MYVSSLVFVFLLNILEFGKPANKISLLNKAL